MKIKALSINGKDIKKAWINDKVFFSKSDYITDGLVLHLNCDSVDYDNKVWVDDASGYKFNLVNVEKGDDGGVYFSGASNSYAFCTGLNMPFSKHTVEYVVKPRKSLKSCVWYCSPTETGVIGGMYSYSPSWALYGDNQGMAAMVTSSVVAVDKPIFFADSNNRYLIDGVFVTVSNSDCWETYGNETRLGGTIGDNQSYSFIGDIYQIRIYDRLLNDKEMKYNQDIDMNRYIV